ncbi:hypothetical protein E4U17_007348 [Claviceps sp. LM77 group G4]|nr:hypothetical protein E4U17_007348 [Claviceps sp. LM77 group G4]
MVKILSILITAMAVLSPVAQAGVCKDDTLNCGSTLKKKRNELLPRAPVLQSYSPPRISES